MKKLNPQPQIVPFHPELDLIKIQEMDKYLGKLKIKKTPEIVFFGSDSWSIHVLKTLEDNFDVKAAVCAPDSPVAQYFKGLILTPDKLDSNFLSSLSRAKSRDHFSLLTSDLFVVASYGKIIPKEFLNIPKYGSLNIHPSLLPKYRGPSPVQATILNGDKETGVTIIKMDGKMDHGPIIYTNKVSLSGKEEFTYLINKLFQLGGKTLVDIIPDFIAGKIKPIGQNHAKAVVCPLIKKEDGYFDLPVGRQVLTPSEKVKLDRMIRAYHPWPGVFTKWKMESGKLKIIKFLPNGKIQMEGKKPISFKDFLNGYPDFPLKSITLDKK